MKRILLTLSCFVLFLTGTLAQHTLTLSPVEDAFVVAYGGGQGKNTFFKFDISTLPDNAVITSTYLNAWVYRHAMNWDGDMRYIFFDNQVWTEADSTQDLWVPVYFTDTLEQPALSFGMVNGFSQSPDLSSFLLYNHLGGDTYFSFRMKDPDDPTMFPALNQPIDDNVDSLACGNIFSDDCSFRPREYVNPNQRPTLTINYGLPPDLISFSTSGPVVCEGDALILSALATGDAPIFYSFIHDGVCLPGNGPTITIDPVTLADAGDYLVIAQNPYGLDSSFHINVTVNPLPVVDLGEDASICQYTSLLLDAGAGFDTYLWNDMSTGQTLTTISDPPGVYDYSVTVTLNGCEGHDSIQVHIELCPGMPESNNIALGLYPNPSQGPMHLITPEFPAEISIFNALGQRVYACQVVQPSTLLNLSHLPSGMYTMLIKGAQGCEKLSFVLNP